MMHILRRERSSIPAIALPRFGASYLLVLTAAAAAGLLATTIGPAPGPRRRRLPPILKEIDDIASNIDMGQFMASQTGQAIGGTAGYFIGKGMSYAVQGGVEVETGKPIDEGTANTWGVIGAGVGTVVGAVVGLIVGIAVEAWHKLNEEKAEDTGP